MLDALIALLIILYVALTKKEKKKNKKNWWCPLSIVLVKLYRYCLKSLLTNMS